MILRRIYKKFSHAFRGIALSFKEERSLVVHVLVAALVVILGIGFGLERIEWAIIIIAIGLVITVEILNTGLENLVDLFEFKFNQKAGKIKDIGAAATLISTIAAIIVGVIILLPHIIERAGI